MTTDNSKTLGALLEDARLPVRTASLKYSAIVEAMEPRQSPAEELVASLKLPYLDSLLKLHDAANGSLPSAQSQSAAAAAPPKQRPDESRSLVGIGSARDLGRLIREARQQRKLSQQAFADLVGVGRRFVSELENGKATLEFDKVMQVAASSGLDLFARQRQ